jgi:hypothetical protein
MDLEGENVASNQGVSLNMGLATDLRLRGFDYFTLGPDVSFDAYRKNLSHFTLGHGGYFSPERLFGLGASAHFLPLGARQTSSGDFSWELFDGASGEAVFSERTRCQSISLQLRGNERHGCLFRSAAGRAASRTTCRLAARGYRHSAQYNDKSVMVFMRSCSIFQFGHSSDLPIAGTEPVLDIPRPGLSGLPHRPGRRRIIRSGAVNQTDSLSA